jgi:hypothetical protein
MRGPCVRKICLIGGGTGLQPDAQNALLGLPLLSLDKATRKGSGIMSSGLLDTLLEELDRKSKAEVYLFPRPSGPGCQW